jgi:hypothetical protein
MPLSLQLQFPHRCHITHMQLITSNTIKMDVSFNDIKHTSIFPIHKK